MPGKNKVPAWCDNRCLVEMNWNYDKIVSRDAQGLFAFIGSIPSLWSIDVNTASTSSSETIIQKKMYHFAHLNIV
jgi:hypothetical protein